jgi:hypothetical protein
MKPIRIRRTATIPVNHNGENILAIIEVGGILVNKNWIYEQFFIEGLKSAKQNMLKIIKERGGTEKDFEEMLQEAVKKVELELESPIKPREAKTVATKKRVTKVKTKK